MRVRVGIAVIVVAVAAGGVGAGWAESNSRTPGLDCSVPTSACPPVEDCSVSSAACPPGLVTPPSDAYPDSGHPPVSVTVEPPAPVPAAAESVVVTVTAESTVCYNAQGFPFPQAPGPCPVGWTFEAPAVTPTFGGWAPVPYADGRVPTKPGE